MPVRERDRTGGSIAADDLVKELVHQFSEPLAFYRELIQNSIDAGANRIDVTLEYKGGRAIMRVEDDGDGMNEKIIDNFLVVKFRSSKDGDLTKIGKFGIGFVSVFAPKPQLVRVYTARDGESWRLDFHSVKHFDKYKMPRPRDGTLIEVHKDMDEEQYRQLVVDSRSTVRYWCRHSETKIVFRDLVGGGCETINEPFGLEGGGATVSYEEEGTQIVLGPAWTPVPSYGFYNRGLTLKEGEEMLIPAVRFKVKSRFLEHTLTRDNVVRDENFGKAMALVKRLAQDELPERALAEAREIAGALSKALADGDEHAAKPYAEAWGRLLPYLGTLFARWQFFRDWNKVAILPALGGKAVSVVEAKAAAREGGALYVDAARTPVSDALDASGRTVLYGLWGNEIARMIGAKRCLSARAEFVVPRPLESVDAALAALLQRAASVDSESAYRYKSVVAGDFDYPGSPIADRVFLIQDEPFSLSPAGETPRSSFFWFGRKRRAAVLNAAHPFVRKLAALHAERPGMAVYLLLKALHLHDGEVPVAQRKRFSALAEKTEKALLATALKLDSRRKA